MSPTLTSLDPPGGRFKSLSLSQSRPERPERVCITLVVFNLPLALMLLSNFNFGVGCHVPEYPKGYVAKYDANEAAA